MITYLGMYDFTKSTYVLGSLPGTGLRTSTGYFEHPGRVPRFRMKFFLLNGSPATCEIIDTMTKAAIAEVESDTSNGRYNGVLK